MLICSASKCEFRPATKSCSLDTFIVAFYILKIISCDIELKLVKPAELFKLYVGSSLDNIPFNKIIRQ